MGVDGGRATGEDAGYLKLVFDGATERLLGVQTVSYAAAELIQLAELAIRTGADARTSWRSAAYTPITPRVASWGRSRRSDRPSPAR